MKVQKVNSEYERYKFGTEKGIYKKLVFLIIAGKVLLPEYKVLNTLSLAVTIINDKMCPDSNGSLS